MTVLVAVVIPDAIQSDTAFTSEQSPNGHTPTVELNAPMRTPVEAVTVLEDRPTNVAKVSPIGSVAVTRVTPDVFEPVTVH